MTLNFSTKFADGVPTDFVAKILAGTKIHTFRVGFRWLQGNTIHMVTGNRTRARHQFNTDRPDLSRVTSVQSFHFDVDKNKELRLVLGSTGPAHGFQGFIYAHQLAADIIGRNDGFKNGQEFFEWFMPKDHKGRIKSTPLPADYEVHGQIIHWTNTKY